MSMGTDNKTVNHGDKAPVPKKRDSTPVRSLTTPWLRCDLGRFYVHVAIVGPIPENPKYDFSLPCAKAQDIYQAAADLVKALEEEPWGKAPPG